MANVVIPGSSIPDGPTIRRPASRVAPLTAAEVAALALSLAHLGVGPQAGAAREALRRLLAEDEGPRPGASAGDVITATLATLTTPLETATASRAKVLAAGISERRAVRLHYRDARGRQSVRQVEPVTCLVHRDHWYVVAWCRLRGGIRAFRFDRLLAVEPTGIAARPHPAEGFLPFQPRAAA
jgi:predicted DNA-binding transcriptional regulator YafY